MNNNAHKITDEVLFNCYPIKLDLSSLLITRKLNKIKRLFSVNLCYVLSIIMKAMQ